MPQFETTTPGTIALIQQTKDGRIVQIALSAEHSEMLQIFLGKLSEVTPLIQMPEEYDLILKSFLAKVERGVTKDTSLINCNLSVRTTRIFMNAGIERIGEIIDMPSSRLMMYRGVGKKCILEILDFKKKNNL